MMRVFVLFRRRWKQSKMSLCPYCSNSRRNFIGTKISTHRS